MPAEGNPWDTTVSLRVEDHPEPLPELRRLIALGDAYGLAGVADELTGLGRHEEAAEVFQQASALAPDNHELLFWGGLGAAHGGELELGVSLVRARDRAPTRAGASCCRGSRPTWLRPRRPSSRGFASGAGRRARRVSA